MVDTNLVKVYMYIDYSQRKGDTKLSDDNERVCNCCCCWSFVGEFMNIYVVALTVPYNCNVIGHTNYCTSFVPYLRTLVHVVLSLVCKTSIESMVCATTVLYLKGIY